ncbi:MAG: ABC transporter substrate-binding protein [Alphaproteobacteria bacterium]|nr:ABC transporter substrate-binding protein [Alphaproteobacteria bacterium]
MSQKLLPLSRRRLLQGALAGAGIAAGGLPLAGAASAQQAPRRGGVLRVSVTQRVATLNPLRHINNPEYMASELLYSGLTMLGASMNAEPDLAERWEANAEATEFTFHLRRGVKFHHGPEVTAADAAATIMAVLDPKTASPGQKNIGPIKEAKAVDSHTLKVVLTGPFADLPVNMAHPNVRVAPAEILARDVRLLDNADHGCGPFKLVRFESDRALRVERYDGYHFPGRPYVDAVEQILYPDVAAETAAIINGETDIVLSGQPAEWDRIGKATGVVAARAQSGRFHNVVMRCDAPPFNDARVRRALALSLDREAIVQLVLEGLGRPAYDNPVSPEYRFAAATPPFKRDVAQAKRLLAQAGHPNGLKITLQCANRPTTRTALGVAMREMARPAGFDIDVQTIPYDTYIANVWRKANFYIGSFNTQATEDALYTLLFTSDAPWNDSQWNNKRFDELVYQGRRTIDPAKRKELYAGAQKLMTDELPYLIPFFEDLLSARRTYVQGHTLHPRGGVFFMDRVWLGDGAPKRA